MGQLIKENLGFDFITATKLGRNFKEVMNTITKTGRPLEVTSRTSTEAVLMSREIFVEMEDIMKRLNAQNDKLFEELAVQRILNQKAGDTMVLVTEDSSLMKEINESNDINKNAFANMSDEELFNS